MLNFDVWSIIWSIANILILYILLRIFLFKPVNRIMDERTKNIQNDIDTAKKSREEAEAIKQQYTDELSNARKEAQDIIMKAHDDAEAEKSAIIERSKTEADKIIADAVIADAGKAAETERKRVIEQAQSQIADLAIEAASKIVGANVDDEKNRRIVDDFLADEGGDKK